MRNKKMSLKKILDFRNIVSVLTLLLVGVVVLSARGQIVQAVNYLANTNLVLILMLIPEQLLMYYCVGQMFFSYMAGVEQHSRDVQKISKWTLARVSFELNFVNHAIPSGGISGLGYITWRLKEFGATPGQTSFMYMLRYIITISANQLQTLVAVFALLFMGVVKGKGWVVVGMTVAASLAILIGIGIVIGIASNKRSIDWFTRKITDLVNKVGAMFARRRGRELMSLSKVQKYFHDLHDALLVAKQERRAMVKPVLWGIVYSFLEVGTYWLVAMSMGHPEILPQIMVAEAIGSAVGAVLVTPGGMGGYEGSMVFVMSALGVDIGLATAVVIATRVVVLVGTILSGYGFYQHAVSTVGKAELKELKEA